MRITNTRTESVSLTSSLIKNNMPEKEPLYFSEFRRFVEEMHGTFEMNFKQVEKRFDQVDKKFDQVDERFDSIEKDISDLAISTAKSFREVDDRFEDIDSRFEKIEESMVGIMGYIGKNEIRLCNIEEILLEDFKPRIIYLETVLLNKV